MFVYGPFLAGPRFSFKLVPDFYAGSGILRIGSVIFLDMRIYERLYLFMIMQPDVRTWGLKNMTLWQQICLSSVPKIKHSWTNFTKINTNLKYNWSNWLSFFLEIRKQLFVINLYFRYVSFTMNFYCNFISNIPQILW